MSRNIHGNLILAFYLQTSIKKIIEIVNNTYQRKRGELMEKLINISITRFNEIFPYKIIIHLTLKTHHNHWTLKCLKRTSFLQDQDFQDNHHNIELI